MAGELHRIEIGILDDAVRGGTEKAGERLADAQPRRGVEEGGI
jgi:hypothetical protein